MISMKPASSNGLTWASNEDEEFETTVGLHGDIFAPPNSESS